MSKTHILILADGRSPTAQSWIKSLIALKYRVSLISTYPCQSLPGLENFAILPVALSQFASGSSNTNPNPKASSTPKSTLKKSVRRFANLFQRLRYYLGPISLCFRAREYKKLIAKLQPDLVHALRIPFEGMLGSYTPPSTPFVVSTWGNDLTLHAKGSFLMHSRTRKCLQRANGLTSDTRRDLRLARQWGLADSAPTLVVPGCSGIDMQSILDPDAVLFNASAYHIPQGNLWAVNPRGMRPGSVHNDVFFAAIPLVLQKHPEVIFICPNFAGSRQAEDWLDLYNIRQSTFLLPKLPQQELWALFKHSELFISPSSHDGTPNTLLEALACGCFPIVGDIESLREWIKDGKNGLLIDPQDPQALADAISQALESSKLRQEAAKLNKTLVQQRASLAINQPKIKKFYTHVISQHK